MSVTSIQPSNAATVTGSNTLDMQTFLKLLTVQLSTQNPLEPMNDRDFFAQMAQLGQTQGMEQLTRQIKGMAEDLTDMMGAMNIALGGLGSSMNFMQANNLIGKDVTVDRPDRKEGESAEFTGTVSKVFVKDGKLMLKLTNEAEGKEYEVSFDKVKSVSA